MMSARFAMRSLRNCATICSSVGAAGAGSADHASGANASATANKNLGFIRVLQTLGDRDYEEGNVAPLVGPRSIVARPAAPALSGERSRHRPRCFLSYGVLP